MKKKYKIEKSVPLPPNAGNRGKSMGEFSAAILNMKPGESIAVPFDPSRPNAQRNVHVLAKRHSIKLATRHTKNGFRVWHMGAA